MEITQRPQVTASSNRSLKHAEAHTLEPCRDEEGGGAVTDGMMLMRSGLLMVFRIVKSTNSRLPSHHDH